MVGALILLRFLHDTMHVRKCKEPDLRFTT